MKKLGDAAGTTADSSPLSCNMKMYIFGHIYGILPLQALAFDRVTAYLTKMRRPRSEKLKLEVIAAMEMCFKEILPNDRLLKWLGHYASYCLSDLKKMPEFQKLLEGAPSLSLTMLKYMNEASKKCALALSSTSTSVSSSVKHLPVPVSYGYPPAS